MVRDKDSKGLRFGGARVVSALGRLDGCRDLGCYGIKGLAGSLLLEGRGVPSKEFAHHRNYRC